MLNNNSSKNSIRFQKLRQTLGWDNVIVMIILIPIMFILIHWSFKNHPLPDYVKSIINSLIYAIVAPIITAKGIGNHLLSNNKEPKDDKDENNNKIVILKNEN